jgi:hypothetical protein
MQSRIQECMSDHKAEQKITDELAKQPKNDQEDPEATEASKQRRAAAEKQLNDSKQL